MQDLIHLPQTVPNGATRPRATARQAQEHEVIAMLTLSESTKDKLYRSNKNPASIRARLVGYRNLADGRSWKHVELSTSLGGDETVSAAPFLMLRTHRFALVLHGHLEYGYVVVSDITTQFTRQWYREQEIGAFLLRDKVLDLCSGPFDSLCYFDNDGTQPDFQIYAWLQRERPDSRPNLPLRIEPLRAYSGMRMGR